MRATGRTLARVRTLVLAGAALLPHALPAQTVDSLREGNIVLHFAPQQRALAEALQPTVRQPLPLLPPDMLDGAAPVLVHLAPDEAAFRALTGGLAPAWGAGVAFPDRGIIVLPAYGTDRGPTHELPRVLRHELAHVALQRFVGPARIPRWFSEGYATWSAGQLDENAAWVLRLAFLTGRAPPLDSLILDWPAGSMDARVAYLLSASAVGWLHENGGDRVFRLFLDRWRETTDFDRALYDVWGLTGATLERDWSSAVRRRYGWLLFLAQSVVIWAILGILVLALVFIRRRRDRLRLEKLRAAEIPDDPAFWLESQRSDMVVWHSMSVQPPEADRSGDRAPPEPRSPADGATNPPAD